MRPIDLIHPPGTTNIIRGSTHPYLQLDESSLKQLERTGVTVQAGNMFESVKFQDYVPGKELERKAPKREYRGPHRKGVTLLNGYDYLDPKQTQAKLSGRKTKIRKLAREIYASHKPEIDRYKKACSIVESSLVEELAEPDERLKAAIRIKNRGVPYTPEQAVQEARERVNAQMNRRYGAR